MKAGVKEGGRQVLGGGRKPGVTWRQLWYEQKVSDPLTGESYRVARARRS